MFNLSESQARAEAFGKLCAPHQAALETMLEPFVADALRPLVAKGVRAPSEDHELEDACSITFGGELSHLNPSDDVREKHRLHQEQKARGRYIADPPTPERVEQTLRRITGTVTRALFRVWYHAFTDRILHTFGANGLSTSEQTKSFYRAEAKPDFYLDPQRIGDDTLPADTDDAEIEKFLWHHELDPASARAALRTFRHVHAPSERIDPHMRAILDGFRTMLNA